MEPADLRGCSAVHSQPREGISPAPSLLHDETISSASIYFHTSRLFPLGQGDRDLSQRPRPVPSVPWGLQTHPVEIQSPQFDFLAATFLLPQEGVCSALQRG